MPDLVLKETGAVVTVAPANLARALASGLYDAPDEGAVTQVSTEAGLVDVPIEQAGQYTANTGALDATPAQVAGLERQGYLEDEHGGVASAIGTGIEQFANEATFGAAGFLGEQILGEGYREGMEGRAELHDTAATIGGLGGAILPAIASGGTSAGAKALSALPSGLVGKLGARITALGAEAGVIGKAAASAAGGSIEGALLSSGHVMAEAVLHDKDLSAEAFVAGAKEGALWGGIGGGAASLIGSGARAATRKVDDLIAKDAELVSATKAAKESKKAAEKAERRLEQVKKDELSFQRKVDLENLKQKGRIELVDAKGSAKVEAIEAAGEVKKSVALAKAEADVIVARAEHAKVSEKLALEQERTARAKFQGEASIKRAEIWTGGNLAINKSKEVQRGIAKETAEIAGNARMRTGLAESRVAATTDDAARFVEDITPDNLMRQVDELTEGYRPSGASEIREVVPARALTKAADKVRRAEVATAVTRHAAVTDDVIRQADEVMASIPGASDSLAPLRQAADEARKAAADLGEQIAGGLDDGGEGLATVRRAEETQFDLVQGLKSELDAAGVPSQHLDGVMADMNGAVQKVDDVIEDGIAKNVEAANGNQSGGGGLADKLAVAEIMLNAAGLPNAEDIPVIGPVLSAYLRLRAFAPGGRTLVRFPGAVGRVAGIAASTQNRASEVVQAIVKHTPAATRAVEKTAPSLTSTLSRPLWEPVGDDDDRDAKPAKGDPLRLYRKRLEELDRALGDPDDTRKRILDSIPAPPTVANAIADREMRKLEYLQSLVTLDPRAPTLRPRPIQANHVEMQRFGEAKYALEAPVEAIKHVIDGLMSPRAAEAVRAVFPRLFQSMQEELIEAVTESDAVIPQDRLIRASLVFPDVPLDTTTRPEYGAARQAEYAQAKAAPTPAPSGGAQLKLSQNEELGGRRAMR